MASSTSSWSRYCGLKRYQRLRDVELLFDEGEPGLHLVVLHAVLLVLLLVSLRDLLGLAQEGGLGDVAERGVAVFGDDDILVLERDLRQGAPVCLDLGGELQPSISPYNS